MTCFSCICPPSSCIKIYVNPEQLARCVKDYGSAGRWLCASSNVHSNEVNGSIIKVNGDAVNKTGS